MALFAAAVWQEHTVGFHLISGEGTVKYLPATVPGGLAVLDFDNDGKLDLFFTNGGELPSGRKTGPQHWNRLLRNTGGLKFESVPGLEGSEYGFGAAAADYDRDGYVDLAVTNLRSVVLYRNMGSGKFVRGAEIDNTGKWSVAAAWLDIENDGDADLFVVNYVQWDPAKERQCLVNGKPDFCHPKFYDPAPNALFRNNGDGTFTDISGQSGIAAHKGKGMSAAIADFNGDGLPDIYVTNDRVFAFLFVNLGAGKFREAAFDWGVSAPESGAPVSGMGTDAQDMDNDGRPDLLLTALRDETFPLFRNTGKDMAEITTSSRLGVLTRRMSGWGAVFADLDNDGWKDIAVSCSDALSVTGGRGNAAMEQPAWFRNTGAGTFTAATGWETLPKAMYRGIAAADLDGDGCLDVVTTSLNDAARILRNPCDGGRNWLEVEAPVLGTRVRVGKQWRHSTTAVGYASSYAGPLHFGLGTERTVTVEAIFPDGSRKQIETPANRTVKLRP